MELDEKIRWKFRFDGTFRYMYPEFLDMLNKEYAKVIITNSECEYSKELLIAFKKLIENAIKVLRDYLRYQGLFQVEYKKILKEAFYDEIITDGQAWINMLYEIDNINQLGYSNFKFLEQGILEKSYIPALTELYKFFEERMGEDE